MILSGALRPSLLQVRRDDVDLDRAVLTFRHMKTGGQMLFPMGTRLAERLRARMEADLPVGNEWLWPSATSRSGHIEEPKENGLTRDRKSVVSGKSVSVRVDLGGRRIINKKKEKSTLARKRLT